MGLGTQRGSQGPTVGTRDSDVQRRSMYLASLSTAVLVA